MYFDVIVELELELPIHLFVNEMKYYITLLHHLHSNPAQMARLSSILRTKLTQNLQRIKSILIPGKNCTWPK